MALDENQVFAPTPRKRKQARERGQVVISPDLVSGLFLLAFAAVLHACGDRLIGDSGAFLRGSLEQVRMDAFDNPEELASHFTGQFGRSAGYFFVKLWPFWILSAVAIVSVFVQTRGLLYWGAVQPSLDHINPATGLQRFSPAQLSRRLFAAGVKVAGLSLIAWTWVRHQYELAARLDLARQVEAECDQAVGFLFALSLGLIAWGVLDYAWRRWRFERQLRMSARELAEEHKQFNPDPAVGRRERELRSKLAAGVSLNRNTDLLITNGLAGGVLLRFDPQTQSLPVIVAQQADAAGVQLLQRCLQSLIPFHESIELHQELSQTPDLVIPTRLWPRIAELFSRQPSHDSVSTPAGEPARPQGVSP